MPHRFLIQHHVLFLRFVLIPPRNTQARLQQGQGTADAPMRRSQCSHTQGTVPVQGESFNLSEVSSDDNDDADNDNRPARQSGGRTQQANPPAQEQDSGVNNPNLSPPSDSKTAAADIRYFFEKLTDKKTVCKECR